MDFMELSRDATRLLSDCQWLRQRQRMSAIPRTRDAFCNKRHKLGLAAAAAAAVPRDFEDPQQADTAEHRDAQRGHDLQLHQDGFSDASAHHEAVEAVKQRHKVGLQSETVHLHQHLAGEQGEQHLVGNV